jgi:hypothetical protein
MVQANQHISDVLFFYRIYDTVTDVHIVAGKWNERILGSGRLL